MIRAALAIVLLVLTVACGTNLRTDSSSAASSSGTSGDSSNAPAEAASLDATADVNGSDGGCPGANDSNDDGGCPDSSPTRCTDCIGAGYCSAGSCPTLTCPATTGYPFPPPPAGDAGNAGAFETIYAQCTRSAPRPLTAGSYTEPNSGLTVHGPSGWTLGSTGSAVATLTTPITWIPTGSTTTVCDDAEFSIWVGFYGSASQPPQAIADAVIAASESKGGGTGSAVTLAGQPAAVWWNLQPVPQPACPGGCLDVPPSPELLHVGGLVQFTTVDAGFGLEVHLDGWARANAQPQQVFCDMEAMILGVTLAR
jgi:hypothetical protein